MIELASAVPRGSLDDRWKVIALVAPHRAHHGELINHFADVREPVGNRNTGLPILFERTQCGDYRPLHWSYVVSEADGIDQFTGVLVVLRIERIDMADATAHDEVTVSLRILL